MKLHISPLWFSIVLFLALLQIGVSITLAYFLAADLFVRYWALVVGVMAVQVIVAVDLFMLYWLVQAVQRWAASEE
ncbi:MAG: hypothetical protein Q9O62_14670 [Ardenticatenia bacterium]|nr:hypothetical protein [Ardenticatenia bacterium]